MNRIYHNAQAGDWVMGTIEYKGELKDVEVQIPASGTQESSVVVNGETFYLRTGPYRCSIRAVSSGLYVSNLRFAFGVSPTNPKVQ